MRRCFGLVSQFVLMSVASIAISGCIGKDEENVLMGGDMISSLSQVESGYGSSVSDWSDYISCWSEHMKASNAIASEEPILRNARSVDTKGPPTSRDVADASGRTLPRSYQHFRQALSAAEETELTIALRREFRVNVEPERFLDADPEDYVHWTSESPYSVPNSEYFVYGFTARDWIAQDPIKFRDEYLSSLVLVSDMGPLGKILLNPEQITEDGEWEAWNLSWKAFGAIRYRSFAELMQHIMIERAGDAPHAGSLPADVILSTCSKFISSAATVVD